MRRSVLLFALLAAACRDGAQPFTPENPFQGDSSGRLTYNLKGDHTPAWNRASDSVYYGAETYPGLPNNRALLVRLPRTGGTVDLIVPSVQTGSTARPWLMAPALSPDGNQIAFFEIPHQLDREYLRIVCPFSPLVQAIDTMGTNSILDTAVLRVRTVSGTGPGDVAQLTIAFPGRTVTEPGAITNIAYPFQRLFEAEGVPIFRASWSPDGTRLAFSNGSQILTWTVGQGGAVPLAGTTDGILPAWSPDGTWIAFSVPQRGATQQTTCYGDNGAVLPAATFSRTIYTPLDRESAQLMLIHPDGTGLRSLGPGDAPAWMGDSQAVIAHRDQNLYRIAIEGGAVTVIPNTLNAFEPALSRDGRFLAFSRRTEIGAGAGELNSKGNYDIWVAPF